MSSTTTTTTTNAVFESFTDENERDEENLSLNRLNYHRPSLVPRQISFAQRRATVGEIILVLLPYFILLIDIFIFFLLRGFKLNSFNGLNFIVTKQKN